ncbi:hypothetical protein BJ944DRAFT_244228 [Cunninghamella echinulata]|nr:hypothetical protein BJ944DRAFT_244228 [Cunninghamella echinulata]
MAIFSTLSYDPTTAILLRYLVEQMNGLADDIKTVKKDQQKILHLLNIKEIESGDYNSVAEDNEDNEGDNEEVEVDADDDEDYHDEKNVVENETEDDIDGDDEGEDHNNDDKINSLMINGNTCGQSKIIQKPKGNFALSKTIIIEKLILLIPYIQFNLNDYRFLYDSDPHKIKKIPGHLCFISPRQWKLACILYKIIQNMVGVIIDQSIEKDNTYYKNLSALKNIQKQQLIQTLEKKCRQVGIYIDYAERHWLALWFITSIYRNFNTKRPHKFIKRSKEIILMVKKKKVLENNKTSNGSSSSISINSSSNSSSSSNYSHIHKKRTMKIKRKKNDRPPLQVVRATYPDKMNNSTIMDDDNTMKKEEPTD